MNTGFNILEKKNYLDVYINVKVPKYLLFKPYVRNIRTKLDTGNNTTSMKIYVNRTIKVYVTNYTGRGSAFPFVEIVE